MAGLVDALDAQDPVRLRIGQRLQQHVLTTEKMAVFAPIPSASAATATIVNPGVLISRRIEWRRSDKSCPWYNVRPGRRGSSIIQGLSSREGNGKACFADR